MEVGFPKPAREIFQRAASLLAVAPASILHLGDSLEEDALGARSAGFQALLLDRKATASTDLSIPTLAAVHDLLGN
jgi:FMN phosphatase YigB (HAD superfamily)